MGFHSPLQARRASLAPLREGDAYWCNRNAFNSPCELGKNIYKILKNSYLRASLLTVSLYFKFRGVQNKEVADWRHLLVSLYFKLGGVRNYYSRINWPTNVSLYFKLGGVRNRQGFHAAKGVEFRSPKPVGTLISLPSVKEMSFDAISRLLVPPAN